MANSPSEGSERTRTVPPRWVVLKFGGTSVATLGRWGIIAERTRDLLGTQRVLIVASALAGVSDRLELALQQARQGQASTALDEVRELHERLLAELGQPRELRQSLDAGWNELERLLEGVRLTGESSPRLVARVMAMGELASTRAGAVALQWHGVDAIWLDARSLLTSRPQRGPRDATYLEARVHAEPDPARLDTISAAAAVALTQGFIARTPEGETCLLGRGGSDTSAALFGVLANAQRVEIWSDVDGMFTADPRQIPSARLIRRIGYREAQELASMGAKVLHPRALPPLAAAGIPLELRNTLAPARHGTSIGSASDDAPAVTAVTQRRGVTLITLKTMEMWEVPGFLAAAFAPFDDLGISIDLVATSQSAVSVTLDKIPGGSDGAPLGELLERLRTLGNVEVVHPCAVISIVGRQIRAVLAELSPALAAFAEKPVHLFSQSSEDLNCSFVVDEDDAPAIVERLHAALFSAQGSDERFGPTWELLQGATVDHPDMAADWWRQRRNQLLELMHDGQPRYVYDRATVVRRARDLRERLTQVDQLFYAMKANAHPELLRSIVAEGFGLECVSWEEVSRALTITSPARILFTPNFAPLAEYARALEVGVELTLDGPQLIEQAPELFRGHAIALRLDPGRGHGHHEKVRTAGSHTKFGYELAAVDQLATRLTQLGIRVVGLHAHVGSGIFTAATWAAVGARLASCREWFTAIEWIDLGGGLGVPERPGRIPLDLTQLDAALVPLRTLLPGCRLRMEPGRYLVSEAGVLLAPVTQIRRKAGVGFVGLATGMNSLIRPALYGAWHGIHNLTRLGEPATDYWHVVGPICETGDVLGRDRLLPPTQPGEIMLIENAGAYGATMASHYNLRPPAQELVI